MRFYQQMDIEASVSVLDDARRHIHICSYVCISRADFGTQT